MPKISAIIPRTEQVLHIGGDDTPKEKQLIGWQEELSRSVTDVRELLKLTNNPIENILPLNKEVLDFPVRVPRPYIKRIKPGDINDPLLKQVLPQPIEAAEHPDYISDPLDETSTNLQPGIIHKYAGRVLLILTGACAINCRYCFRRHFPYSDNQNNTHQWLEALNYIRNDQSITEVIYSGGDPLLNSDKKLRLITQAVSDIPHIKRLRIHTRLPVVIPQRITTDLIKILTESQLQTTMVLHINHPNEIDTSVLKALEQLRDNNITLLNQSVLLKEVNDKASILGELSESLFGTGVLPYYLHLLDKVKGAAHFDTPQVKARQLVGELTTKLPGYLVPKLVVEKPGQMAKTPLTPIF